jgi:pSer/pThr/pTyr-binding forkhead associated (FHA) protein
MQVKLRVIGGKNDGKELEIKVPEFLIGRGDGVNLRPKSDLISRHHCAVILEDGQAFIKDLESRNGTHLNGERISGKVKMQVGDRLRVGRLQFEVLIDHGSPGRKKPRVTSIKDAAQRTAEGGANLDEDSITDWLFEAEKSEKSTRLTSLETRQFRIDETDNVVLDGIVDADMSAEMADAETGETQEDSGTDVDMGREKKSKKPGKLPNRPRSDSTDSKNAATDMLRKFFNRR